MLAMTDLGKKIAHSPSAAEPGEKEKKTFWLLHIPCAAQFPCVWNLPENCWAETCGELGTLCSLVIIKLPKTSGLPFESLQVRNGVTKINCDQSGQE